MATCDITDVFIQETGRILNDQLFNRTIYVSPVLGIMPQGLFPGAFGATVQSMVINRPVPPDLTWTPVLNGNELQACNPTTSVVSIGQTLSSLYLSNAAIESDPMCLTQIFESFEPARQLNMIVDELMSVTGYIWARRFKQQLETISYNQLIASQDPNVAPNGKGAGFPVVAPTSGLTPQMLRSIHQLMNYVDPTGAGRVGRGDGGSNVNALYVSEEAIANVLLAEDNDRRDINFSDKANDLLRPYDVDRSYWGFAFLYDQLPFRWNIVNNAWSEVLPYADDGTATRGTNAEVSAAYIAANYEDVIFHNTQTMESMVQPPASAVGRAGFDPRTFRGEFRWVNNKDNACNKDGLTGYFRALFSQGPRPIIPRTGFVERIKRCVPEAAIACNYSYGYNS